MNKPSLKTSVGLITIISLSLILAACGGGSVVSYSPVTAKPVTAKVSVSATPSMVASNTTTAITWSSTDSTSCTSSPSGITGTSGQYTTPPLTASTTYTITCTGPTGAASNSVLIPVTSASIVAASTSCPAQLTGTVYYYCDCGTGAESSCVPGNNENPGTNASAPRRTIGHAAARFGTLAANDTVALCKGGAFDAVGVLNIGSNNRCASGVACNDLRDYSPPTFVGTAKPIINSLVVPLEANTPLFRFAGNGGVRLLNLKLNGGGLNNVGAFFIFGAKDITMCNLDIDRFGIAVYSESGTSAGSTAVKNSNIKLTGSYISNSSNQGFLGGADNLQINHNHWEGNGSQAVLTHAIYFSSNNTSLINVQLIGNYVHGQFGPVCKGVVIVGHVAIQNFRFENNTVDIDPDAATLGCFGIGFSASKQPGDKFLRNANFSNNIIKNGGLVPFSAGECPNCLIENNLVIQDWPSPFLVHGMSLAGDSGRLAGDLSVDDVSNNVKVINNTVWFGPRLIQGGKGIQISRGGTGHIFANNTVTYTDTRALDGGFSCYEHHLAPSPSAFINNNHCQSAAPFEWVKGRGTLAAWQGASGFDTASITGNPLFTAAGTNFKPATGSPLISAGNTTHKSNTDFNGTTRPSLPAIGAFEPLP